MFSRSFPIYKSLISRLIGLVGIVLFFSIFTYAYFNIEYQKKNSIEAIVDEVERLGNTIRLGTHYAMMLNSREDINEIIKNIAKQEGIENIRIYNKEGQIKFSNIPQEVDRKTSIKAEACDICHKTTPPPKNLDRAERTRIFSPPGGGYRLIGLISPICNELSCATDTCHVHPQDKKILGALDVVFSLKKTDHEISVYERRIYALAIFSFLGTSAIITAFLLFFVNRPIKKLITWTRRIADGEYEYQHDTKWGGEIGQLAIAVKTMTRKIREKQEELNFQRDEYQELFEQVPCYITVQDRDLKLIRYNREFSQYFAPTPGDFCYSAYKGRTDPCEPCPVIKTFRDGKQRTIEETGINKDGTTSYWIGRTSPIRDPEGKISAVMEMSIDITQMKLLEEEIRKSEAKYRYIFNNIPNPVFVLDQKSLTILDCNESVRGVYGYRKEELVGKSFLNLFEESEHQQYALEIRTSDILNTARQTTRNGSSIYVNVRVSPSEYLGRKALLITTSDVTKRLMAEQQLIQASKMATLGEMATGIAHELNQPLTVIKTASSFIRKKVKRGEEIKKDILTTLAEEIDSHVDRASGIINHLREFGRKSDVKKSPVQVNIALERALAIFNQQLKLREIQVEKHLEESLPSILGDQNRLEQVFINLLINARDAIEEKQEKLGYRNTPRKIVLKTCCNRKKIMVEVKDTGIGIPKSVLDKIYEPFFTTKKVGKGTGLGLSISYGIIQDYDGTIRVETEENEGSTFIIEFPIVEET